MVDQRGAFTCYLPRASDDGRGVSLIIGWPGRRRHAHDRIDGGAPLARPLRVLLVADSHLGFDHPTRPRVHRRRRGYDFLAGYERALEAADREAADLVVHGGDVFHRPDVPATLVHQAFAPLERIARDGRPVFVVPGNHERSRIPFRRLARHPGIHVFEGARTVAVELRGIRVAVSGLPCIRRGARAGFPRALVETRWAETPADVRLLVAHQAFEGAVVGPAEFMFRDGHDVVRLGDVPPTFAAVLAGHIHRSQVLDRDLRGRPSPAPVLYPGSIERTAFAERDEAKGFLLVELEADAGGGRLAGWRFRDLGARPMLVRSLRVAGLAPESLTDELARVIASVPPDAVLRLEADGPPAPGSEPVLRARRIRELAPETMNVEVRVPGARRRRGGRGEPRDGAGSSRAAGRRSEDRPGARSGREHRRGRRGPRAGEEAQGDLFDA